MSDNLSAVVHDLTAAHCGDRPAGYFPTLTDAVIGLEKSASAPATAVLPLPRRIKWQPYANKNRAQQAANVPTAIIKVTTEAKNDL